MADGTVSSILKMRQTFPTPFLKIAFNSFDAEKTHSGFAFGSKPKTVAQDRKVKDTMLTRFTL